MSFESWERRYPKRRTVRGGIESSSRRGSFGRSWWARALVDAVESVADPGRMTRGRTYARAGQVISMQVERTGVAAEVQGSQPAPFAAVFALRPLDDARLDSVVALVRDSPGMLAAIVSGALPAELGPILLPAGAAELVFDCTCPDSGWPCKHVAAVVYLTAERLDAHALDILTLRGIDLDTLISEVERTAAGSGDSGPDDDIYGDRTELPALPNPERRGALSDLDQIPLRRALRLVTDKESDVGAAVDSLALLYRRLQRDP